MARTKTRLFLTGVSALAVAASGVADDWDGMAAYASPAGQFVGEGGGEGEGEGGEGLAPMAHEDAVKFALGIRALEAELNAGWAAATAGDMPAATDHFKEVLALLSSPKGDALEEEGLERDHMADEIRGLIMVSAEAAGAEEVRDLYEHGLHEVDEHIIGIDPLVRRDAGFAKAVILGELREAGRLVRLAARGEDAAATRRAVAYAELARTEFGTGSVAFARQDADRAAKVIEALDEVITRAAGDDVKAALSAISRAELALSGF